MEGKLQKTIIVFYFKWRGGVGMTYSEVMDENAKDLYHWAAAGAEAIVVVPLLGTVALCAHEVHLVISI